MISYPKVMPKQKKPQKSTSLSVKCLKDFIESTDLLCHVNILRIILKKIERC